MNTNRSFQVLMLVAVLFVTVSGMAQQSGASTPLVLEVAHNKTSTLIFRATIANVDRGSADILAQRPDNTSNIVQVKSAINSAFPETNLTVITTEGHVHHFLVRYNTTPPSLTYKILSDGGYDKTFPPVVFGPAVNEGWMAYHADKLLNSTKPDKLQKERKHTMKIFLTGVYASDEMIFVRLSVRNKSNIPYDVDLIRFTVRDKVKLKRTASQEVQLTPLYAHQKDSRVPANQMSEFVFVFNKFTIGDDKDFILQFFERNGGRHMELTVKNKHLTGAHRLRTDD